MYKTEFFLLIFLSLSIMCSFATVIIFCAKKKIIPTIIFILLFFGNLIFNENIYLNITTLIIALITSILVIKPFKKTKQNSQSKFTVDDITDNSKYYL